MGWFFVGSGPPAGSIPQDNADARPFSRRRLQRPSRASGRPIEPHRLPAPDRGRASPCGRPSPPGRQRPHRPANGRC